MLPTTFFSSTDLPASGAPLNSSELLPNDADLPAVTFASRLQAGLSVEPTDDRLLGTDLPVTGNFLPEDAVFAPIDAEGGLGETEGDVPLVPFFNKVSLDSDTPASAGPMQAELQAEVDSQSVPANFSGDPAQTDLPLPDPTLIAPVTQIAVVEATSITASAFASGDPLRARQMVEPAALANTADKIEKQSAETLRAAAPAAEFQTDQKAASLPQTPAPLGGDLGNDLRAVTDIAATGSGNRGAADVMQAVGAMNSSSPSRATAAAPSPLPVSSVEIPMQDDAWSTRFGEKVVMLANHRIQNAEIRLTPAEMGPVRVQIAMDDTAATVTFHASQALTRDALEQALPRLREMLAESGVVLDHSSVSDQGVQQGGDEEAASTSADGDSRDQRSDDREPEGTHDVSRRRLNGLVDTFV